MATSARAYVKFYPEATERVRRGMIGSLQEAGRFLRDEIKKVISIKGNGVPAPRGKPPHFQTGKLYRSVRWEKSHKYGIKVTAGMIYGLYLEYGVHPFMRRTIWANRAIIRKILGTQKGIDMSSNKGKV